MFCLAGRRVRNAILSPLRSAPPDPYGSGSPNYAERNRESVTELPNGLVRVDIGEPAHWAASAVTRSQPKPASKAAPIAAPAAPTVAPAVQLSEPPKAHRQDHRAITRNP
jgi:hypothetical protein